MVRIDSELVSCVGFHDGSVFSCGDDNKIEQWGEGGEHTGLWHTLNKADKSMRIFNKPNQSVLCTL